MRKKQTRFFRFYTVDTGAPDCLGHVIVLLPVVLDTKDKQRFDRALLALLAKYLPDSVAYPEEL